MKLTMFLAGMAVGSMITIMAASYQMYVTYKIVD